jgi:hypothetical protein
MPYTPPGYLSLGNASLIAFVQLCERLSVDALYLKYWHPVHRDKSAPQMDPEVCPFEQIPSDFWASRKGGAIVLLSGPGALLDRIQQDDWGISATVIHPSFSVPGLHSHQKTIYLDPPLSNVRDADALFPEKAKNFLQYFRRKLAASELNAYILHEGQLLPVPNHYWNTELAEEVLWNGVTAHIKGVDQLLVGPIVVSINDLKSTFKYSPLRGKPPSPSDYEEKQSRRELKQACVPTGRPPVFNGEDFLIEAAKLVHEGFQPKRPADLIRKALDVYSASLPSDVSPPTEAWARKKIRKLWDKLQLGDRT